MEIRDARSLPSNTQEDLRRKAVNAVLSGKKINWTRSESTCHHELPHWYRSDSIRGLSKSTFYLHLKECEFRFNHRGENLYKLLL